MKSTTQWGKSARRKCSMFQHYVIQRQVLSRSRSVHCARQQIMPPALPTTLQSLAALHCTDSRLKENNKKKKKKREKNAKQEWRQHCLQRSPLSTL